MLDFIPVREFTVSITAKVRLDQETVDASDDVLRSVEAIARDSLCCDDVYKIDDVKITEDVD